MAFQFTDGRFHADDALGAPLVGGRLYTYDSGTTNFKTAYATAGTSTPAAYLPDGLGGQYIELNARGEAQVWLSDGQYTVVLKDANGVTVWSVDGVTSTDTSGGGGGGGTGVTVVVIGDSMSAANSMANESWPAHLQTLLNSLNAQVTVHNLAKDGWTFNKANAVDVSGGQTMVEAAIALNPQVVIVALGANDAIFNVEARTSVQQQADAVATFTALRAALPDAVILYGSELLYDAPNFPSPGVTLKNKGVPVSLWQTKTAGILTGLITSECLEDGVSFQTRSRFADWVILDGTIKALGQIDDYFTLPHWKACRLGLCGVDNTHLTALGQRFLAAAVVKYWQQSIDLITLFPNVMNQDYLPWNDPDDLFTRYLTDSGDGYVNAAYDPQVAQISKHTVSWPGVNPDLNHWLYPSRAVVKILPTSVGSDTFSIIYWEVMNATPNTTVEVSSGGGAFAGSGQSTDSAGNAQFPTVGANFAPGAYTFRYKVGVEVFGPFSVTISASAEPSLIVQQAGNQATGGAGTYTATLGTTVEAVGGGWVSPTYTVPRAGRYQVSGQIALDSVPAGGYITGIILRGGARHRDGDLVTNGTGGTSFLGATVTAGLRLAVGDTIALGVVTSGACGNISAGAGQSTHLSVQWLGT